MFYFHRYFPLNTVLNIISSPMRNDEGGDSPSEESAEESDVIESSSDESGSESSERNFKVSVNFYSYFC